MKNKRTFVPKYKKLLETLIDEISSDFKKGDLFYSQRDLMKNLSASYATVSHILAELKKSDIIETHVGKGIFIKNIPEKPGKENITISLFIDSENFARGFNSPIEGLFHRALIRAEEKYNCKVKYHIVEESEKAAIEEFKKSGSEGIIFIEERFPSIYNFAVAENIAHAVVHPLYSRFDYSVDIDDVSGIKTAISAMAERGSSKILLIGNNLDKGHNRYKVDGYKLGLEACGLEFNSDLIVNISSSNISGLVLKLREVLSVTHGYDGIFVISPEYFNIVEENINIIPPDILRNLNIAVCGDYGASRSTTLEIGVVDLPYEKAIDSAIDIIIRKIKDRNLPPQRILLKPGFRWKNN